MSEIAMKGENGEIVEWRQFNREVAFVTDSKVLQPAVVERLEWDHEGGMSQISFEACRKVENRRESDKHPDLTVEGIVSEDQARLLKSLPEQNRLILASELHKGDVIVKRTIIEQNTDVIHISIDGQSESQLAFPFQLQLKVPSSRGNPQANDDENENEAEVIGTMPILRARDYERSIRS